MCLSCVPLTYLLPRVRSMYSLGVWPRWGKLLVSKVLPRALDRYVLVVFLFLPDGEGLGGVLLGALVLLLIYQRRA